MKIGILTLQLHSNYGGILQAYALQTTLKKMGHQAWLVNRKDISVIGNLIRTLFGKKVYSLFKQRINKRNRKEVKQHTQPFIDKHIQPQTKPVFSSKELRKATKKHEFNAYIVGSDQVWRPQYAKSCLFDFFLDFLDKKSNVKRISYAASFGTEDWDFTEKQQEICKKNLQQFNAVSVREQSGVKLCKEKFSVEAQQVIDPSLLLTCKDYEELIQTKSNLAGELLVYVIDNTADKTKTIHFIEKKYAYRSFRVNSKTEDTNAKKTSIKERIAPPVDNWLNGFKNAQFIITDSFHACAFAIIFNKPFIVYGNKNRGISRFTSLLQLVGLENRLILSADELTEQMLNEKIDWESINAIIEQEKTKAINFLHNALSKENA